MSFKNDSSFRDVRDVTAQTVANFSFVRLSLLLWSVFCSCPLLLLLLGNFSFGLHTECVLD